MSVQSEGASGIPTCHGGEKIQRSAVSLYELIWAL